MTPYVCVQAANPRRRYLTRAAAEFPDSLLTAAEQAALTLYSLLPRRKNNTMRGAIPGRAEQQTQLSVRFTTNDASNSVIHLIDGC